MSKYTYTIIISQNSRQSHLPIVELYDYNTYEAAIEKLNSLIELFNEARGWELIEKGAHKLAWEKEGSISGAQLVQRNDHKFD